MHYLSQAAALLSVMQHDLGASGEQCIGINLSIGSMTDRLCSDVLQAPQGPTETGSPPGSTAASAAMTAAQCFSNVPSLGHHLLLSAAKHLVTASDVLTAAIAEGGSSLGACLAAGPVFHGCQSLMSILVRIQSRFRAS